jgi:hypothetical protein
MTAHENGTSLPNIGEDLAHDVRGIIEDFIEDLRTSDVFVNNQPLRLPKHRITGAEIKSAAIAKGIQIDAGFQLWWERGGGREQQVGDNAAITTLDGHRFTAVAPDDNS